MRVFNHYLLNTATDFSKIFVSSQVYGREYNVPEISHKA